MMEGQSGSDSNKEWLFFHDRPVGLRIGNILWTSPEDVVWQQIDDIARRLVEPLVREMPSNSLTFSVQGDWGAGKSSFQNMIKERAIELATNITEGNGSDKSGRLKFCDYVASFYINPYVDVRATLAMQVLTTLADGDREKAQRYYQTRSSSAEPRSGLNGLRDPRGPELNINFQELAVYLSRLVDFPGLLSIELIGGGQLGPFGQGTPGVLVVMIDDLDRCPASSVREILSITQQWGSVQNLFFVLAVNQNVLLDAIGEGAPEGAKSDPDYALEKYVQHTVTVPPLDGGRLRSYVTTLLQEYYENDQVSKVISDNVNLETGLRYKTPRAVKRCLNTIRPDIRAALSMDVRKDDSSVRQIIKERVLQYSWREFYEKCFRPAMKDERKSIASQRAWRTLESVCVAYVREPGIFSDYDEQKLDFELQRVKVQYGNDPFTVPLDRDLVKYLRSLRIGC